MRRIHHDRSRNLEMKWLFMVSRRVATPTKYAPQKGWSLESLSISCQLLVISYFKERTALAFARTPNTS